MVLSLAWRALSPLPHSPQVWYPSTLLPSLPLSHPSPISTPIQPLSLPGRVLPWLTKVAVGTAALLLPPRPGQRVSLPAGITPAALARGGAGRQAAGQKRGHCAVDVGRVANKPNPKSVSVPVSCLTYICSHVLWMHHPKR